MKLKPEEKRFLQMNDIMLNKIFNLRVEELKDIVLDIPNEEREKVINYINENRYWINYLEKVNELDTPKDFTGI
jgi:hypothetical protein